ncbi:uncharacterized protein KQ657_004563 [Scheffersomyces spartinae]|uniref:N-glycosylation protein EOS1 n=1 Tax=Scheffersomyces spartinae TaxID=45513 RepID=A0A9P7VAC6_9ASCO|nr:uncharacterized protein KQ657_004563 [Scheffersomyces spartinae]KAG7194351.1 hypothetical protein KQ657_004563 [Scheffersomyces spartinae]
MPLLDLVCRRLTQPSLSSHVIDDDYILAPLSRRGSTHPQFSSNGIETGVDDEDEIETFHLRVNSVDRINYLAALDPDPVPSYEDSQLMYGQPHLELSRRYQGRLLNNVDESTSLGRSISTPNMFRLSNINRELGNIITVEDQDLEGENEESSGYSSSSSLVATIGRPPRERRPFLLDSNGDHPSTSDIISFTTTNSSNSNIQSSRSKTSSTGYKNPAKSLKQIGLKFLNARQHFALAICRDICLVPPLIGLFQSWKRVFFESYFASSVLSTTWATDFTSARTAEHFLTGIWCIVAAYLSYAVLDGLMVRWIVNYLAPAAIVRMLSMSTILIAVEQYTVSAFSANGYKYGLHIWILVSCIMTGAYIIQNFVTSNLDLKGKRKQRFFDFYNIVVFAVVPVGFASFLTMIGLLRSLLILRLDLELNEVLRQMATPSSGYS